MDDATPSAMVVVGDLDGRRIEIDFMSTILGVDDDSILDRYVTLTGTNRASGAQYKVMLLHPLDCLKSRFANIDVLGRTDELSLRQARIGLRVVELYVDEILEEGDRREAQETLRQLFFVGRDRLRIVREHDLSPVPVMARFLDDQRLDERWRVKTLRPAIERLVMKIEQKLQRRAKPDEPAAP